MLDANSVFYISTCSIYRFSLKTETLTMNCSNFGIFKDCLKKTTHNNIMLHMNVKISLYNSSPILK